MYEVKNVKSCASRNGLATSCTIYKQGKKIGEFIDEGNGGMAKYLMSDEEQEALLKFAQKQSKEFSDSHMAHDMYISELCDEYDYTKKSKKK